MMVQIFTLLLTLRHRLPEMNLALDEPDIGRFRINIFKQRTHLAMVIRNINIYVFQHCMQTTQTKR